MPRNFTSLFIDQWKDMAPVVFRPEEIETKQIYVGSYKAAEQLVLDGKSNDPYELVRFKSEQHRLICTIQWKNAAPFLAEDDWRQIPWFDPIYQILFADKEIARFEIIESQAGKISQEK